MMTNKKTRIVRIICPICKGKGTKYDLADEDEENPYKEIEWKVKDRKLL